MNKELVPIEKRVWRIGPVEEVSPLASAPLALARYFYQVLPCSQMSQLTKKGKSELFPKRDKRQNPKTLIRPYIFPENFPTTSSSLVPRAVCILDLSGLRDLWYLRPHND